MNNFKLEPGDIGATKSNNLLAWLQVALLKPETDRFHHFLIWKPFGDEYLILESISKGLAVGKLGWYQGKDIKFYRVNCPEELRFATPDSLIDWGRSRYDYWLILKIFFGAVVAWARILWKEHKVRKLRAEDLPYGVNSALICTEAVDVAYDAVGVNLIPPGVVPIPSAFKAAELEGRLIRLPLQ